ncbi:MAG: nucleotidyltransferase domain-containing protein [Deinococcota bacterium]
MSDDLNFGLLEHGPHITLVRNLAEKCYQDSTIQAIWVGGSLAAGTGDAYSDIDFRIAVEPEQLETWHQPDWEQYLPMPVCGSTFMKFGDHALLHHMVLADGTIVDFYVQDTLRKNLEPALVVIACRDATFAEALTQFTNPALSLVKDIESTSVRQFLVSYWITTHKEAKGLGRKYDYSQFVGLYFERIALLRAWYMEITGKDIEARVSIHMLGALHQGLRDKLSKQQQELLGLPSTTVEDMVIAVESIRTEMARVGRKLSQLHGFDYPHELERVVLKTWDDNKDILTQR